MDIVKERAIKFIERKIRLSPTMNKFLIDLDTERKILRNKKDEIKFISKIYGVIESVKLEHDEECQNPETCSKSIFLKESKYFVNQIISELGVKSENVFSNTEIIENNLRLEKILKEIESLKIGQEALYNDLYDQIHELKELYFLGKRNWKQIFLGKITEMTLSGVVSESLSKEIISIAGLVTENLKLS